MPVDHADDRVPEVVNSISGYLTADWHFPEKYGTGPWAGTDMTGDAEYALEQVVALCAEDGADLYAAGDLVDGPDPDPDAVTAVYAILRRLTDAGRTVHYVLGNHDRGRDWLKPFGSGAVRADSTVSESTAGTVTGLSFRPPHTFRDELNGVVPTDIGLYHQTWSEFVRAGRTSAAPLADLHGVSVCGDVHVRSVWSRPSGGGVVVSPGPLCPQSVTEFGTGHFVYALSSAGIVPVRLKGRRFVALAADDPRELDRAVTALRSSAPDPDLPDRIARPFYSVRLGYDASASDLDGLERAAAHSGAVLRVYRSAVAAPVRKPPHPTATLTEAIAARDASPEAKRMAADLVNAADPAAVLETYKAAALRAAERSRMCPSRP